MVKAALAEALALMWAARWVTMIDLELAMGSKTGT